MILHVLPFAASAIEKMAADGIRPIFGRYQNTGKAMTRYCFLIFMISASTRSPTATR